MSRRDQESLEDIQDAIGDPLAPHPGDLSNGLGFDAVRIRLLEIGEPANALPVEVIAAEPDVDWPALARFRTTIGIPPTRSCSTA